LSDVLSQAEIDDLVSAIHSGSVNEDVLRGQTAQKVRIYDFRKPNKFSKEQVSTFQVIYGNYSRALGTFLSVSLRSNVHVSVLSIEQVTYEEFIHSLTDPWVSVIFTMPPLEGTSILEVSPELTFAMLERLMGGRGGQSVDDAHRPLTEIERILMENLSHEILDLSIESWENILSFSPRIERIETNPQFVQVVSPSEMVLLISLELKIGNLVGVIQYCLPYIVLEPVLDKFSTKYWFETSSKDDKSNYEPMIKRRIASVKLPVCAILGETTITLRELIDLEVGDVVMLNRKKDENLDVIVGASQKYYACPGLSNNKLAVKIIGFKEEDY